MDALLLFHDESTTTIHFAGNADGTPMGGEKIYNVAVITAEAMGAFVAGIICYHADGHRSTAVNPKINIPNLIQWVQTQLDQMLDAEEK
jgi:hypothetical protein